MTIKEKLMELVIEAYKRGHGDCQNKCEVDVASLEKKVDEALIGSNS